MFFIKCLHNLTRKTSYLKDSDGRSLVEFDSRKEADEKALILQKTAINVQYFVVSREEFDREMSRF